MLAFPVNYYGLIFRVTQSVELFCAYEGYNYFPIIISFHIICAIFYHAMLLIMIFRNREFCHMHLQNSSHTFTHQSLSPLILSTTTLHLFLCYRRLNKQRSVFPSSQALLKALYLRTFEIAKKWTMPIRNWGKVRGELEIIYPDRMQI